MRGARGARAQPPEAVVVTGLVGQANSWPRAVTSGSRTTVSSVPPSRQRRANGSEMRVGASPGRPSCSDPGPEGWVAPVRGPLE